MQRDFRFSVGDKVRIDGDVIGVVSAITMNNAGVKYCIEWWTDGKLCEAWLEGWRLGAF